MVVNAMRERSKRRVPVAIFETDPEAIIDEVERDGVPIALVRDGVDIVFVMPPGDPVTAN